MFVLKKEPLAYFDVDDTLVIWNHPKAKEQGIKIECHGAIEVVVPHKRHIQLLVEKAKAGNGIVVWSQGGYSWAYNVVKALALEMYVDIVLDKPYYFVDDLRASEFLTEDDRIYLPDK